MTDHRTVMQRKAERTRQTRLYALAMALGGFLMAATLFWIGVAHADPADPWDGSTEQMHDAGVVCQWLNMDPTETGMVGAMQRLLAHGLSTRTAGDTMSLAIAEICPEYRSLFARTYRDIVTNAPQTVG